MVRVGLISSFKEARAAVDFRTLSRGLEDEQSYLVHPADNEQVDDVIWFVDKADGKVHPEVAYTQFDRTSKMVTVVS